MLELLVAASLATGLVLASVRGQERQQGFRLTTRPRQIVDLVDVVPRDAVDGAGFAADLPCPWCLAPTGEDDTRCSACGQRFG